MEQYLHSCFLQYFQAVHQISDSCSVVVSGVPEPVYFKQSHQHIYSSNGFQLEMLEINVQKCRNTKQNYNLLISFYFLPNGINNIKSHMATFQAHMMHHLVLFQQYRIDVMKKLRKLGTWYCCVCCLHPVYQGIVQCIGFFLRNCNKNWPGIRDIFNFGEMCVIWLKRPIKCC